MDEYTKLKTTLEAYLDMPDVEVTHHEISIYTLQQILNSKLEELRKIQFDSDFKDEINNSTDGREVQFHKISNKK